MPPGLVAPSQKSKEPIKLGFVTSLTGSAASGGQDMVRGIKVWFDLIDHKLAGRPVELIIEDDQHTSTYAVDRIRKLVEVDKVHILAGTISSNIAYTIASFVNSLQVPMIFPITGADDLTKRRRYDWVIRTGFSSSQYGLPFGEWVFNKLGYKRIVTFGLDYALGWEIIGSFQKTYEQAGGQILQKTWSAQGFVDFSNALRKLRTDADAVFFSTSNQGADTIARQYREFGPKLPLIGGGPGFDETVLQDAGAAEIGAISVSHHCPTLNNAGNERFTKAFKKMYGADASTSLFSEGAFTSGLWIQKAVEALNGEVEDKAKLLAELKKVSLPDAPRGPMEMDTYGNPVQNIYVRRVDQIGGKIQNTVIHTIPKVSQFWTYDPVSFMKEPPFSRDYPPCRFGK
jgi:branched-chain amino acid transport system substrate-binding protein